MVVAKVVGKVVVKDDCRISRRHRRLLGRGSVEDDVVKLDRMPR